MITLNNEVEYIFLKQKRSAIFNPKILIPIT